MSVATQLGLTDPDTDLLGLARVRWAQWASVDERLAVTDDLMDLPAWIAAADPAQADRVLLALAKLGSPTGGDDQMCIRDRNRPTWPLRSSMHCLGWVAFSRSSTMTRSRTSSSPGMTG